MPNQNNPGLEPNWTAEDEKRLKSLKGRFNKWGAALEGIGIGANICGMILGGIVIASVGTAAWPVVMGATVASLFIGGAVLFTAGFVIASHELSNDKKCIALEQKKAVLELTHPVNKQNQAIESSQSKLESEFETGPQGQPVAPVWTQEDTKKLEALRKKTRYIDEVGKVLAGLGLYIAVAAGWAMALIGTLAAWPAAVAITMVGCCTAGALFYAAGGMVDLYEGDKKLELWKMEATKAIYDITHPQVSQNQDQVIGPSLESEPSVHAQAVHANAIGHGVEASPVAAVHSEPTGSHQAEEAEEAVGPESSSVNAKALLPRK